MTAPPFATRAVLFDLDGTLADTAPDLAGALNRLRERRGLDAVPLERLRPVASSGARGLVTVGFGIGTDDARYIELRDAFLREYESGLDRDSRLFDGVPEMLQALQRRCIVWGIVTNKATRFTEPVVAHLGLDADAAVVIAGDTTAHAKPHPAPLLEACRRLGVSPMQTVYVGDDLRDIQAAHAAGMPGIAAGWGYLGEAGDASQWHADALIERPGQLAALLRPAGG